MGDATKVLAALREAREKMDTFSDYLRFKALPALVEVAEAAAHWLHVHDTRERDESTSAASGLTYSAIDLAAAINRLDAALERLAEVKVDGE